jgi:hypothetical protein
MNVMETNPTTFKGNYLLSNLSDGIYRVEGRIKDLQGNYTILSEVVVPLGTETVRELQFHIVQVKTSVLFDDVRITSEIPFTQKITKASVFTLPIVLYEKFKFVFVEPPDFSLPVMTSVEFNTLIAGA